MGISNRINKAELSGFLINENLTASGELVSDNLGTGGLITIGEKGIDGYSPIVTIEEVETSEGLIGHSINITDIENPLVGKTFFVWNGVGISGVTLNPDYTLTISFNDGTSYTTIPIRGETGNGIDRIVKTSTSGLVDTYTIYFTDGTTTTYQVTNGLGTLDYNELENKPSINGVTLTGNKSSTDLGIQDRLTSENAGEGIDITTDQSGKVIISNTNVSAEWGNIQGNITDQEDLIDYINQHSGSYTAGNGIQIVNKVISIKDLILDCGTSTGWPGSNVAIVGSAIVGINVTG